MVGFQPWTNPPMIRPPMPPSTRMGMYLCVMMASGRLISSPKRSPTIQPGHTSDKIGYGFTPSIVAETK